MSDLWDDYLSGFDLSPPASERAVRDVEAELHVVLPPEYKAFLLEHDGGEGFIGDEYLAIWSIGNIVRFNREYEVDVYAPGLVMFGSNGGGDGFAFDARMTPWPVLRVDFVGMSLESSSRVADSFGAFLKVLKDTGDDEVRRVDPNLVGKEIFEIQPVILNGSPTDPENKALLTREQHMQAVRYWNKIVSDLRRRRGV